MKAWVLACLAAAACGNSGGSSGPHLTAVSPTSGPVDTMVTLTGTGFCGGNGSACGSASIEVELDTPQAVECVIESVTDTQVEIQIPVIVPVGSAEVIVDFDGQPSNELPFTVTSS